LADEEDPGGLPRRRAYTEAAEQTQPDPLDQVGPDHRGEAGEQYSADAESAYGGGQVVALAPDQVTAGECDGHGDRASKEPAAGEDPFQRLQDRGLQDPPM